MKCPICRRETSYEGSPFRPFCSERCKLIDLDRWLSERYRIPIPADNRERNGPTSEPVKGDKGGRD